MNRLLKDEGIVRHRGKIEAAINNAQRAQQLVKREGSPAAFVWRYEPGAGHRLTQPPHSGKIWPTKQLAAGLQR